MNDEKLQLESFAAWVLAAQIAVATGTGVSNAESLSVRQIAAEISRHNKEHFVLLDKDGKVVAAGSGERNGIGFSREILTLLRNPQSQLTLVHNHPEETSLSRRDIDLFQQSPGLTSLNAVTPNRIYTISWARSDVWTQYNQRYSEREDQLRRTLKPADFNAAMHKVAHEVMTELHKKGIVKYSVTRY